MMAHYQTAKLYVLSTLIISVTSFGLWMIKQLIKERWFDNE